MALLIEFVLRLAFGLAVAMLATSPKLVTVGFFRVHCFVLFGLGVVASLAAYGDARYGVAGPVVVAVASYLGSVAWLVGLARAGQVTLGVVAIAALASSCLANGAEADVWFGWVDPLTAGLVLGFTIAAMLLGHWYLNTPTMKLEPLKRLIVLMTASIGLRAVVAAVGLAVVLSGSEVEPRMTWLLMLALRWSAGIAFALVVAWMTWQTLKVPNTQSATGILYVGVIVVFLGELMSQLLSDGSAYPL